MQVKIKILWLGLFVVLLGACTSTPERPSTKQLQQDPQASEVLAHQQQLNTLQQWSFKAKFAYLDTTENKRQAAHLRWENKQYNYLRISHPLKGTLLRLEILPNQATMTDAKGQTYQATNIEQLLYQQFGFEFPYPLLQQAVVGALPHSAATHYQFYSNGTIAAYQALYKTSPPIQVFFESYQSVTQPQTQAQFLLPEQIKVIHPDYELKLHIQAWSLTQ